MTTPIPAGRGGPGPTYSPRTVLVGTVAMVAVLAAILLAMSYAVVTAAVAGLVLLGGLSVRRIARTRRNRRGGGRRDHRQAHQRPTDPTSDRSGEA